jgi:hypothetical protein
LIPDPDAVLRTMLVDSMDICTAWTGHGDQASRPVDESAWVDACGLTAVPNGR